MNQEEKSENTIEPLEVMNESTAEKEEPRRLLSLWPGRQTFLLDGKIILGPKSNSWMPYLFLNFLGVLSIIFYIKIMPKTASIDSALVSAGFTLCLTAMLFFYCAAMIVEPGVIPPESLIQNPNYFLTVDSVNIGILKAISRFAAEKRGTEKSNVDNNISNNSEPAQDSQDKQLSPENVHERSNTLNLQDSNAPNICLNEPNADPDCETCKIIKLPDSGHCPTCDSCVRYFMGHSNLLNKCVGKRNYRAYFLFIAFSLLFTAYLGLSCFASLNHNLVYAKIAGIGLIAIMLFESFFLGLILCFYLLYILIKNKRSLKTQLQTISYDTESADVFWTSLPLVNFSKIIEPLNKAVSSFGSDVNQN